MHVGHIVSLNHLSLVEGRPFHLILAHLVDQHAAYRNFYAAEAKRGAFIVLDNSAFELGEAIPPKDMIRLGEEVGAKEIMAPEVYPDGGSTRAAIAKFVAEIKRLTSRKWGIIATIHGRTVEDWVECFSAVVKMKEVTTIGLSCRAWSYFSPTLSSHSSTTQRVLNRIGLTSWLESVRIDPKLETRAAEVFSKKYHLLGATDPVLELTIQSRMPWIRSIDTSSAFAHGARGIEFLPRTIGCERVGNINFFETLDDEALKVVLHNIAVVDEAANPKSEDVGK